MTADVHLLRPKSSFAGIVEDDEGRGWALHIAPSLVRGWVKVHASSSGGRAFDGGFVVRHGDFDWLSLEHGQTVTFVRRIAEHLRLLAGLIDNHDLPVRGAYFVLADAMRSAVVA